MECDCAKTEPQQFVWIRPIMHSNGFDILRFDIRTEPFEGAVKAEVKSGK